MAEFLLVSETFVKEVSNISDNVSGKYILPSIREAQEIKLRSIVGTCLYDRLMNLGKDGIKLPGNEQYKALVDECQYFLAYTAIVEILPKVSYKVGNFGVAKSNDENLAVVTQAEVAQQQEYYQAKADYYCLALQQWLLDNKSSFPELDSCQCGRIRSNLYSAATCGLWLGGPRGKVYPSNTCKCVKK